MTVSWTLTRSGRLENEQIRTGLVVSGAFLGLLGFALPFFAQCRFRYPAINYGIGVPLAAVGLVGRVYPMIHLRRQGTTTALGEVEKLVDTGPYSWVRHPQYSFGFVLLCGWYVIWGAVYSLGMMPFIGGMIYVQALIEENGILEKRFGREYAAYSERVGMLIPRIGR